MGHIMFNNGSCVDCKSFTHYPATMYNRNGDPGDPEENNCDHDWCCPHCEHFDKGTCCIDSDSCDGECENHHETEDEEGDNDDWSTATRSDGSDS